MLMSDALERIEQYAQDFREGVARCAAASMFKMADVLDAYNRLNRLRDRYRYEACRLTPSERHALTKVFDDDVFIRGMLEARQIGEHVTQRRPGPVTIRTVGNAPIDFDCKSSSALAYFAGPLVEMPDVDGQSHDINHLEQLREAEKRITRQCSEHARHRVSTHTPIQAVPVTPTWRGR